MNFDALPDSIHIEHVRLLVAAFGLPLDDVQSLEIGLFSVRATVHARNADGRLYVDSNTGKATVHEIHIPIVGSEYRHFTEAAVAAEPKPDPLANLTNLTDMADLPQPSWDQVGQSSRRSWWRRHPKESQ